MSISELASVIHCDKLCVNFNGFKNEIDPSDQLQMAAYGDFLVDRADMYAVEGQTTCEITVKTSFLRKDA